MEIQENALMLDPFPDVAYAFVELELQSGDLYLPYTDGILEAENSAHADFAMDRLMQFLESNHELPAAQFADALLHRVSRWPAPLDGNGFFDDVTLLAIHFQALR